VDEENKILLFLYEALVLFGAYSSVSLFTPKELQNLRSCSRNLVVRRVPPSERVLWDLHTRYAPSARDIFSRCEEPQHYMDIVNQELENVTPTALRNLLLSPQIHSDTSHLLVLIEPSPTSRSVAQRKVITTYVFNLFWNIHLSNQARNMAEFYDTFRGASTPTTSHVAGTIFEVRIHQLLKSGRPLTLTPIRGHIADRNVIYSDYGPTGNRWILLGPLAEALLTDGITLNPGHYYQPQIHNFPSIDSLTLFPSLGGRPPILIMFQITCNVEKHDVKKIGLERIKQLGIPPNAERILVIVTPEDVKPKITVPRAYLTDTFLANRNPDTAFPVYHLQITRGSLF